MSDRNGGGTSTGRRMSWLYGVFVALLGLDQLTKALIVCAYEVGDSVRVLGPVMSFTRRTNTGGAFGLLPGSTALLAIVSGVVLLMLLILGPRLAGSSRLGHIALGLVAGGAAGNLLDRMRLGHVVDFIEFHFWPVFNLADAGITVGALLLVAGVIAAERKAGAGDRE